MKNYQQYKNIFFIVLAFVSGSLLSIATTAVLAHGGDTSKLHVCVDDTTGAMRMVGVNDTCPSGEHNVDWDQDAVASVNKHNPPVICPIHCWIDAPAVAALKGKDFTHAFLNQFKIENGDMSNTTFSHAFINSSTLGGSDFSGTDFDHAIIYGNIEDVDFTDADFSNATVSASVAGSNLQNTNFTNTNLQGADLTDATNMDTATITGVVWGVDEETNTVCPDGTNSYDNSDTCVGHLTP